MYSHTILSCIHTFQLSIVNKTLQLVQLAFSEFEQFLGSVAREGIQGGFLHYCHLVVVVFSSADAESRAERFIYRSGTVNSKSFVGKVCFELSGNSN